MIERVDTEGAAAIIREDLDAFEANLQRQREPETGQLQCRREGTSQEEARGLGLAGKYPERGKEVMKVVRSKESG